jgi:hypothetical protein
MIIKDLNSKLAALALVDLENANKTNEDNPNMLNVILSGI